MRNPLAYGAPLLAALALAAAATSCAAKTDRVAPFRERPDATGAGELEGPFTGQVVRADTGEPVGGAVVYASWTYEDGYGERYPAASRERVTETDDEGYYWVRRAPEPPGDARLAGAQVIVYKPGYVAYRSDRRFSDLALRRDFAQRHNRVALEPWKDAYSHARHMRFLGSGEVWRERAADERERAAAELAGDAGAAPPRGDEAVEESPLTGPDGELPADGGEGEPESRPPEPGAPIGAENGDRAGGVSGDADDAFESAEEEGSPPFDAPPASELLTAELVAEVTGDEGPYEARRLPDREDSQTYSSQHLRATDRAETYDVALRLWVAGAETAEARYEALEGSLPRSEERGDIGDRSLSSGEPGIHGVAFYDGEIGATALLICGEDACSDEDTAGELARQVREALADAAGAAAAGDGGGAR